MNAVTLIDYGIGNLLSVVRSFEYWGARVDIATTPSQIRDADRLVLPGVGAFADGMKELRALNLIESIHEFAHTGKPFLGICLGMQMMLTQSHEFGEHAGLNLISGTVSPIPLVGAQGAPHKVPHIGWSALMAHDESAPWSDSILKKTQPGSSVYFVHSYRALPTDPSANLAQALYHGLPICAVLKKDNLYGCQFHPEKSGEVGLEIIGQFLVM